MIRHRHSHRHRHRHVIVFGIRLRHRHCVSVIGIPAEDVLSDLGKRAQHLGPRPCTCLQSHGTMGDPSF